ncbi:polysaccharide biosynthesis protein [Paenibacillus sp. N4]|uniref:SDR family NAD(P)-dependent oxidoreductase n=1 Tax=Paenibacillus vietnamensis TaxID=2590547 RepID=UPI001CD129DA|nr:SDR family NAD(P)-dependent oxidoreductase [Paenibacillus vietnamensis]MCA0754953.1 polysaccharide biosynthesis protein [Paenibacillus vietnamensis]
MFFKDKKILIIGGTGTIGRSLLKHLLLQQPKVVRIFSRDEYKQFELANELGNLLNVRFLIGDVRDYERVSSAMQEIDYVFHVAAMKHVPACEYNPYEAVLTNIIGTNNVIKAAIARKVKKVVFTSTDKAISPTNTYGATKLTSERLVAAAEFSKGMSKTTFAIVRFGNVIGSRGSVIPLFIKQIKRANKITLTDPTMSRFMMTLQQATVLTIKALQQSKGGEVFVLKMPVINLKDLATIVIEETCKRLGTKPETMQVETIGIRPGEKMFEELMTEEESRWAWEMPDMYVIPSNFVKRHHYPHAIKAAYGTYSSHNQQPISIEETRRLILETNLFE